MTRWLRIWFVGFLLFAGLHVNAQTDSLTIKDGFEEQSLSRIFRKLRQQYDINFAYDSRALSDIKRSIEPKPRGLNEFLDQLLNGTGYTYRLISEVYVITPVPQSSEARSMLSGRVFDIRSEEPLPFTTIQIQGSYKTYVANQDGRFTIEVPDLESFVLEFRFTGFQAGTLELKRDDIKQDLRVYLEPFTSTLPEARVVENAALPINEEPFASIQSMGVQLSEQTSNVGLADPFKALQLLPGVDATGESSAGLIIRGASADQLLILYDGFTVYHVDHLYGIFSAFNPESIKHMRLHKSAFEARLGDRNGSVLEITGKEGNRYNSRVSAGLNFIGADVCVELPAFSNKGSVVLTARRSYTDVAGTFLFKDLFNTIYNASILQSGSQADVFSSGETPNFYFYDLSGRATVEPGKKDKLVFSVYHGRDALDLSYLDPAPGLGNRIEFNDMSSWGNTGLSGKWNHTWNERSQSSLVLAYSRYNSQLDTRDVLSNLIIGQSDTIFTEQSSLLEDRTLRFSHQVDLGEHRVSAGMWLTSRSIDYRFDALAEGQSAFLIQQGNSVAFYLQDEFNVSERWQFNIGLRAGYNDLAEDLRGEPRFGLSYAINDKLRLKAAVGWHHQEIRRIRRQNLYLSTPDVWRLANITSIPVLSSVQTAGGLTGKLYRLDWDLEAWYRESAGELLDPLNLRLGQEDEYLVGDGKAYGVDLNLRKEYGRWQFNMAYTLSEAIMRFDEVNDRRWIYSPNDIRHQFKLFQSFIWKDWRFGATMVYGSGVTYTPALGTYEVNLLNGTTETYAAFGIPYSGRLPAYHRMDLSANYRFALGSAKAEAGVSVYNVYNRENVRNRTYFLEDEQGSVVLNNRDLRMLGLLPSFQLRLIWE